jgi:hypothetical protein
MLLGFSCVVCPACIVRTSLIKALTEMSYFCRVRHRSLHPRTETKTAFETLRWYRPVVFYQASVSFLFEQRNYTDLVHCFYSIVLGVSAVYCSCHQVGILVHKKSKRGEASPFKQWVKSYCKIYDYKSKLPNVYEDRPLTFYFFFVNQYSYSMTAEIDSRNT